MSEKKEPEVGDYVVVRLSLGAVALIGPITRVTDKTVSYCKYGSSEGRCRRDELTFWGNEPEARRLLAQLVSSAALCRDERRAAEGRQRARDEKIIAKALREQSQ